MDTSAVEYFDLTDECVEQKTHCQSETTLTGKKRTRDSVQETKVVSASKRLKPRKKRACTKAELALMATKKVQASIPYFWQPTMAECDTVPFTCSPETLAMYKNWVDMTQNDPDMIEANYTALLTYNRGLNMHMCHEDRSYDPVYVERALINFAAFADYKFPPTSSEAAYGETTSVDYEWHEASKMYRMRYETPRFVYYCFYGFNSKPKEHISKILHIFLQYYQILCEHLPVDIVKYVLEFATDKYIYKTYRA